MRHAKSVLLALLSTVAVGGVISGSQSGRALAGDVSGQLGEQVSPSSADQLALVEHLRLSGILFYGAWWCPHCTHQKTLFGSPASQRLPYVECDKDDAGRQRCAAAGIRAFPTWILKGERREGVLTLDELKLWTGFQASAPQGVSTRKPAP